MERVQKIRYFVQKYHVYQDDYEYYCNNIETSCHMSCVAMFNYNTNAPPFLYDALLSGCQLPFCKGSTPTIDLQDVVDMVHYCPDSVKYNMGHARCRNGVSPLWAIVSNRSVPSDKKTIILGLLLTHGAAWDDPVFVNHHALSIRQDAWNNSRG